MREILFRAKANSEVRDGEWVYGSLLAESQNTFPIIARDYDNDEDWISVIEWDTVDSTTIGQFTGFYDTNNKRIFEGDIVVFLGSEYQVVFECGSFGIAGVSDWEAIEKQIPISTGCDNELHACLNDNYISLWEIYWNLENSHEVLDTVKIIGNIHDNPELLESEDTE